MDNNVEKSGKVNLRVADYDRNQLPNLSEKKRRAALKAIIRYEKRGLEPVEALGQVAAVLELTVGWRELPAKDGGAIPVVTLSPTTPEIMMIGFDTVDAAQSALRYLRRVLVGPKGERD